MIANVFKNIHSTFIVVYIKYIDNFVQLLMCDHQSSQRLGRQRIGTSTDTLLNTSSFSYVSTWLEQFGADLGGGVISRHQTSRMASFSSSNDEHFLSKPLLNQNPQIFDRIQIRRIPRPIEQLDTCLCKPLLRISMYLAEFMRPSHTTGSDFPSCQIAPQTITEKPPCLTVGCN